MTTQPSDTPETDVAEQLIGDEQYPPYCYAVSADFARSLERQRDEAIMTLREIAKGTGAFSQDRLEHASNTIEHMKGAARTFLAQVDKVKT